MKLPVLYISLVCFCCSLPFGYSQNRNWTEYQSQDGEFTVKYEILKQTDKKDQNYLLAYYEAETVVNLELDQALTFLFKTSSYQLFLENNEETIEIEWFSEFERLFYLRFDAPWPLPNYDCIHKLKLVKHNTKELIVTAESNPDLYGLKKLTRMRRFNLKYHFVKQENGKIRVTLSADFIPVGRVSKWMLNTWFPKGPQRILQKLVQGISQN